MVRVRGLARAYGDVQALQGIDFDLPRGSVLAFLGPNGAGKTTAIKILCGYLAADAGEAWVCGHEVSRDPLAVKQHLGYLPENNPLYTDMRVEAFLKFAARARGLDGPATQRAVERSIGLTGLEAVWRRPIGECSKGYRQRVGLAQALLHDPELLVLDEPTNGLDPLQVVEMRALIRELGRTKTVIMTTHVLPEVEALADRVVLIHQGRKVADGPLASLTMEGGGGLPLRLRVECPEADLQALLDGMGIVHRGAELQLASAEQLPELARALAAKGWPVLECTPQGGSLEAVFQRLTTGGSA